MKILLAIFCFLLMLAPAHAVQGCGNYELFRASLLKNYREVPKDYGVGGNYLIILFLSPDNTFTIVARSGNGFACIVAAGNEWVRDKPEPPWRKS